MCVLVRDVKLRDSGIFLKNASFVCSVNTMSIRTSRRRLLKYLAGIGVVAIAASIGSHKISELTRHEKEGLTVEGELIRLPEPRKKSSFSIEEAIESRRSCRSYTDDPVLLGDISHLSWAAQGITEAKIGFRAAPSAGALYPLEVFLVIGNSDIAAGVYHYRCGEHALERVKMGDYRKELCEASLEQEWVEKVALDLVITAIYDRTMMKYGESGRVRYVPMEAGHVAENIYLQAESLGLGTVSIGAFYDDKVREVLSVPSEYVPLYVMPVGHVR